MEDRDSSRGTKLDSQVRKKCQKLRNGTEMIDFNLTGLYCMLCLMSNFCDYCLLYIGYISFQDENKLF